MSLTPPLSGLTTTSLVDVKIDPPGRRANFHIPSRDRFPIEFPPESIMDRWAYQCAKEIDSMLVTALLEKGVRIQEATIRGRIETKAHEPAPNGVFYLDNVPVLEWHVEGPTPTQSFTFIVTRLDIKPKEST